jgi:hypothetical protein
MAAESVSRVRVAVRCRPQLPGERADAVALNTGENGSVDLRVGDRERSYAYDTVFGPQSTQVHFRCSACRGGVVCGRCAHLQDELYNEVGGPIVARVLNGFNGSILAVSGLVGR